MTTITQDAAAAFRDYETDGVPASGAHKPGKADIRALFARIDTAIQAMAANIVPVGTVAYLGGAASAIPAGWLVLDGSTVSRTTYAALFAFAQAADNMATDGTDKTNNPGKFGPGNGTTTFELPKIEDFISGLKSGRDPGTFELDQMQRIQGNAGNVLPTDGTGSSYDTSGPFSITSMSDVAYSAAGEHTGRLHFDTQADGSLRTGTYTRPRNTSYPAIIKY